MSDSYDGVPRKIEWVGDSLSIDNPCREQLLVMTADRDAWRKMAQHAEFYKTWADFMAACIKASEPQFYELGLGPFHSVIDAGQAYSEKRATHEL